MLKHFLRVSALVVAISAPAYAGDSCCTSCGCHRVKKVCVPVCETIKETTWEYCCKCEDFCVPGPSKCVGTCCEPDCSGCPKCVKVMQPTCGGIFTRNILLKTPVVKEKCVTKWVVKTVCCGCDHDCASCTCAIGELSADADLQAPPMPTAPALPAPPMPTRPVAPAAPMPPAPATLPAPMPTAPAAPAAPMPPVPPTPAKLSLR
jgi:hypothetical protein